MRVGLLPRVVTPRTRCRTRACAADRGSVSTLIGRKTHNAGHLDLIGPGRMTLVAPEAADVGNALTWPDDSLANG